MTNKINMIKNQIGTKAIRADRIEMVRCYHTKENNWLVWGKLMGTREGFTFGAFQTEKEAFKYFDGLLKKL